MKSKSYSKRLAMTALGALFAIPVFAADNYPQGDIQYREAAALPDSIIDPVSGNDVRDNRDSTILRSDVPHDQTNMQQSASQWPGSGG